MNKKLPYLLAIVVVLGGGLAFLRTRPKKVAHVAPPEPPKRLVSDARSKAVLEAADAACRKLTAATFEAGYEGKGVFAYSAPVLEGTVSFDATREWVRIKGNMTAKDESKTKIEQACDGEQVVTIDHKSKRLLRAGYPFGRRLLSPGIKLRMAELGHEAPFSDELEGGSKYEGTQEVGGKICDVVYVEYQDRRAARWFIAQEDHLPRRVERIYNNFVGNEDRDKTILTLTNLNVHPVLTVADFRIPVPEGYEDVELQVPGPLLVVGTEAPPWELKTPDGTAVRLADLRGSVVVLDFWATWCGPCKMAMPGVQQLHAEFENKGVKVFGVNCQEDEGGDPKGYMKSKDYTYGLLLDGDKVASSYQVGGIPTFYVIDREGRVAYSASGYGEGLEVEIKKAVVAALGGDDSPTS